MNRSLLTFLITLFSFAVQAQYSYVPMNLQDGQWRYRLITEFQNGVSVDDYLYMTTGSDTVINSITYKKVFKRSHSANGTKPFAYPLKEEIAGSQDILYTLIREDNKKVYLNTNTGDTLLYDFNRQVNDTLPTYFSVNIPVPYQPVYVIHSIDTISINGTMRKRFTAHSITVLTNDTITVVEGIGSINRGLIMNNKSGNYGSYTLTQSFYCYTSPGIQYPANSDSCYYIWPSNIPAGINDANTTIKPTLYPNPFIGALNYDTEASGVITVYNAMGTTVIQQQITQKHTTINTSALSSGIYIITLTDNSGQAKYRQVVIK